MVFFHLNVDKFVPDTAWHQNTEDTNSYLIPFKEKVKMILQFCVAILNCLLHCQQFSEIACLPGFSVKEFSSDITCLASSVV